MAFKDWLLSQTIKQEQQSLRQIENEQKMFEKCVQEGNFEEAHLHRVCRDIDRRRHDVYHREIKP